MENEGASHYNGSTWTHYNNATGLMGDWFNSVEQDANGNVYVCGVAFGSGSSTSYVNKFDGTTWTSYSAADGITISDVMSIFSDSQNNLWIGGMDGVMKFDGTSWTTIPFPPVTLNGIVAINEDGDGNIWFGESSVRVFMYDGTTVQNMQVPYDFAGRPDGIGVDSNGIPYVCTQYGIYYYEEPSSVSLATIESNTIKGLYPNPTNDQINIELSSFTDEITISIANPEGKIFHEATYYDLSTIQCDVSKLPKGVYFLFSDKIAPQKIIIQ